MRIATLLFTYNRYHHTKQVVDALKQNTMLPQKLLIFQDGLKEGSDEIEWKKVNDLICSIDWCDKEIIVSSCNKGLAVSIVSGIKYAFREYEAVIVLEDDCVPMAGFISFMNQCLEKYVDDKRVYSISGYGWPIQLEKKQYDVYGCGRISSWGWGTWKERWHIYEKDYEIVRKMKQEPMASRKLAMWGQDLEDTLVGNIKGICDSWAVFWALNVIGREGICINPYQSLIKNIGLDGSGVHCGITDWYDVECMDDKSTKFNLPDEICVLDETVQAFAPLYGSYTALNCGDMQREKVLVYGLGNYYLRNEKIINERYNIEAFIDRSKKGWFAGKRIISMRQIRNYSYDKVLIMVWNVQECINIINELADWEINKGRVLLGREIIGDLHKGGGNGKKDSPYLSVVCR